MTTDTTLEEIQQFVGNLDAKNNELYLYLMGGNEENPDLEAFLQSIRDSLNQSFGNNDHITSEEINLINLPDSTSKWISTGLTRDGDVFWCYGLAD